MTYTDHVLLNGIQEARAHQRGEPVGKPVPPKRPKPPRDPNRTVKKQKILTAEQELDIATREAKGVTLALEYGIDQSRVSLIRKRYREKGL